MWWVESEEDLRAMVGRFVEMCRRRGLKINADKTKVMVFGGEGKEHDWSKFHISNIRGRGGLMLPAIV